MRIEWKNLLPALFFLIFGIWLLHSSLLLNVELAKHVGGGMNAAGYPRFLALMTIGLALLLLVRSVHLSQPGSKQSQPEIPEGDRPAVRKGGIAFLGVIVYTLLLIPVGYLIVTPCLLGLVMVLVGERRWIFIFVCSILLTLALYAVSFYAFHIVLPEGVLRFIRE